MTIRKVFRGIAAVTYASLAAAAGAAGAYRIDTLRHTPATEPVRVSGATESIGISSCQDISRPGTYVLTRDLEAPAGSDCIKVLAAGVTLDLDGFSIRGTSSRAGAGINANAAGADDFSARNGAISGFWIGAVLKSGTIERLTIQNVGNGLYVGSGAVVGNRISAIHTGIQVHSARVEANEIRSALSISCSVSCFASGNIVRGTDSAIAEADGQAVTDDAAKL